MLFWIFNSFSYLIQTQEMDLMQGPSMNNFLVRQRARVTLGESDQFTRIKTILQFALLSS